MRGSSSALSTSSDAAATRRLRAPGESGRALLEPPRAAIGGLLEENRARAADSTVACGGMTLSELSRAARSELLERAWSYTSAYRDAGPRPDAVEELPLLLTGHQPQLFHAGVWFKNFLLAELGQRQPSRCVNLLIDNDLCRSTALRVPTGSLDEPRIVTVPYDRGPGGLPYEECRLNDPDLFQSFARRVTKALRPLIAYPLVQRLWQHVPPIGEMRHNLGRGVALARNRLESEWGLNNWELPLSGVCRGESFRAFLTHLLVHGERLREVYNQCLGEYRRVNKIRSRSHPVPALGAEAPWRETPFWIWTRECPQRRGLWVRPLAGGLEITDRRQLRQTLLFREDGDWLDAVAQWRDWEAEGIRIRPRALVTTMFARLVLCDLFIHGIGGAKYDELTDAIIERFFAVPPPRYVVATATVRLPLNGTPRDSRRRLREVDRELREMRYHPERFLPDTPEVRPHVEQKQAWLAAAPPRRRRKARHEGIESSNRALQPYLQTRREHCLEARRALEAEMRRERLLASREFSFCLFPETGLPKTLLELSRQEP